MNIHLERYKQQIIESSTPQLQSGNQAVDILKNCCKSLSSEDRSVIIQALEGILDSLYWNNDAAEEFVDSLYDAIYNLQPPDHNRTPPGDDYESQAMDSRDKALGI